ncbi:MAG: adenylate/guanylate cyclase domain-containing protein [Candidatus Acidiferrales bacterium]
MARNQVEELLNARAEIDEQLRRHKNLLTVLFTDIVGSTSYFDRFGDTAGLAMVHLNSELGTNVIGDFGGTIVKTIGDSIMADFPEPKSAVKAAIEMQRRLIELNSELPDHRRMELRIGIHSGMGFRKGADVFGDVVNLAARITKRTEAAQILISHTVQEAIAAESEIACRWLDKCTIDGRNEKEDIFAGISVLASQMSILIHPRPSRVNRIVLRRIIFQFGEPSARFAPTWSDWNAQFRGIFRTPRHP